MCWPQTGWTWTPTDSSIACSNVPITRPYGLGQAWRTGCHHNYHSCSTQFIYVYIHDRVLLPNRAAWSPSAGRRFPSVTEYSGAPPNITPSAGRKIILSHWIFRGTSQHYNVIRLDQDLGMAVADRHYWYDLGGSNMDVSDPDPWQTWCLFWGEDSEASSQIR